MSAIATIFGLLLWVAVLSLPLAIYFLYILVKRGREVEEAHWADLRPPHVETESKPLNERQVTEENREEKIKKIKKTG